MCRTGTAWDGPPEDATLIRSKITAGEPDGTAEEVLRLAELVAAFSLAIDPGLGQPVENVLRSWLISLRLGERMGLEPQTRQHLYYVTTLGWAGCVADTPEMAAWFGDDIASLRHLGVGASALHRLRLAAKAWTSETGPLCAPQSGAIELAPAG